MSNQLPADEFCVSVLAPSTMSAADAEGVAPLFKALGDPVRLRLLAMIAGNDQGETCVCDLTGSFDLTAPTISHHLKVLRQAGLVVSERRGTWVFYRVERSALDRLQTVLGKQLTGHNLLVG